MYHGGLPNRVIQKLDSIATPNNDSTGAWNGTWFYDGSLDQLFKELSEVKVMFFAYPKGVTDDNTIYVTHHNSWGSR